VNDPATLLAMPITIHVESLGRHCGSRVWPGTKDAKASDGAIAKSRDMKKVLRFI
jgi:hypothetical protein